MPLNFSFIRRETPLTCIGYSPNRFIDFLHITSSANDPQFAWIQPSFCNPSSSGYLRVLKLNLIRTRLTLLKVTLSQQERGDLKTGENTSSCYRPLSDSLA